MNRLMKRWTVAVLLLCLCVAVTACRTKPADQSTPPTTTTAPQETTNGDTQPDETSGTTAPTQTDTKEPPIQSNTDVGSGRGEGSSGSERPETTTPTTQPSTPETLPDDTLSMNYRQYMALSPEQQQALFDKYFAHDPRSFADWFKKIKQEHDDEIPEIIATGPVDIGDYINP